MKKSLTIKVMKGRVFDEISASEDVKFCVLMMINATFDSEIIPPSVSSFFLFYTVRTGFLLMSQKRLFLNTSCTQTAPRQNDLNLKIWMYLYLKCMLF